MKIVRVSDSAADLLQPDGAPWRALPALELAMVPTPLYGNPAIEHVSPFLAQSTDHGTLRQLAVRAAHNGSVLAVHLTWAAAGHSRLVDLDEFVDGAAVMFPLDAAASALTMGAPGQRVNAWYWKADQPEVGIDVTAEGYGTSVRHGGTERAVTAAALHRDGRWQLVLGRAMNADAQRAAFVAGGATRIAFALWDGGNRERAGRKSFSGDFMPAEIAA